MTAFLQANGVLGRALARELTALGLAASGNDAAPTAPALIEGAPPPDADLAWQVRAWGRRVLAAARRRLARRYPNLGEFRRRAKTLGADAPDGRPAPLVDQAHRLMQLWRGGDGSKVNDYLDARGLTRHALFGRLRAAGAERARPVRRGGAGRPGVAVEPRRRPRRRLGGAAAADAVSGRDRRGCENGPPV